MTQTESSSPTALATEPYLSLKLAKATKSGARSQGYVHYRILTDVNHSQLFLTFVANDSSGCFSREIVPFERVETALQGLEASKPIASKLFQPCFVSKSQNNAGFLIALLRSEGLLKTIPDAAHQHALAGDWPAWKTAMLALADGAKIYRPEPPKPRGNRTSKTADSAAEQWVDSAPSDSDPENENCGDVMPPASSVASTATETPDLSETELELLQCSNANDITNQSGDEESALNDTLVDNRHGKKQRRVKREHPSLPGGRP
jgi:hypothetical protein